MKRPARLRRFKPFDFAQGKIEFIVKNYGVFVPKLALISLLATFLLCILGFGIWDLPKAEAAVGLNRVIPFQGRVVNKTSGTNVTDGTYSFTFKLYDAASSGNLLWSETQSSVTVTSGIFAVNLGSSTAFNASGYNVDFKQNNLYLDVTFNGETFGSRVQLAAVPQAINAEQLSGVVATQSASAFTLTGGTSTPRTLTISGADITVGSTITPTSTGALTVQSNGASALTLDTGSGATLNLGNANATTIQIGNNTSNPSITIDSGTGTIAIGTGSQARAINIGTGAASQALTIGSTNTTSTTTIQSGTGNILLGTNTGNGTVIVQPNGGGQASLIVKNQGVGDLLTASSGASTKFVIDKNGQVGIGQSTPTSLLDVEGTVNGTSGTNPISIFKNLGTGDIVEFFGSGGLKAYIANNGGIVGSGLYDPNYASTGINICVSGCGNQSLQLGGQAVLGAATVLTPKGMLDVRIPTYLTLGTQPIATFSGKTSFAGIVVDNSGLGDIFTASSSGLTRFTISQEGNISDTTAKSVNFSGAALTVASCTGCGGGQAASAFNEATGGIIVPINTTEDVLIGGTATISAKFAVLNMTGSNTPTASVSSGLNGVGAYLTAAGTLATTSKQALSLGDLNTGAINIGTDANTHNITIGNSIGGTITIGQGSGSDLALNDAQWSVTGAGAAAFASVTEGSTALNAKYAPISSGYVTTAADGTLTGETAIGALTTAISTSSNISTTGTGTITSAGLLTATAGVSIGSSQNYTGAGAVTLTSGNGTTLTIDSGTTGALNIGTGANGKTITIGNSTSTTAITLTSGTGNITLGGTTGVGNILIQPDAGGAAALVVNKQNSTGDIFTASASGTPKFTISNVGAASQSGSLTLDTAATISTTKKQTLIIGDTKTGAITIGDSANTNTAQALTFDQGAGNINIGTSTNAKTITIGASSGSNVQTVSIGTNSAANLITIGGTSAGASSFKSGAALTFTAGATSVWSTSAGDLTIQSGATSTTALNIDTASTGQINIGGTNNSAKTINIGNATAGNTINIGTNDTTADTITIGSSKDAIKLGKFTTANEVLYISATDGTVSKVTVNTGGTLCLTQASSAAPAWGSCAGAGGTLQSAYDAASGNTINLSNNDLIFGNSPTGIGNVIINPNAGGDAALIVDKTGASGNAITASISGKTVFQVSPAASGTTVNGIQIVGSSTTNTVFINPIGTDATAAIGLRSRAGGNVYIDTGGAGSGGVLIGQNTASNVTIGTTSNHVVFGDFIATSNLTTQGELELGSTGTLSSGGRIWTNSNGRNWRFNSVANSADYSEYLQQSDTSEPGDVMVMSKTSYETVSRSTKPYDQNVLGVVTKYGTSNNAGDCWDGTACDRSADPHWANVGMLGQVYTKVSVENGNIQPGDPLTTSSVTGVAMKATKAGRIVGYALDTFDGTKSGNDLWELGASGTWDATLPSGSTVKAGKILILLQASWYDPSASPPDSIDGLQFANDSPGTTGDYGITDTSGRSWDNIIVAKDAGFANLKVGGITFDKIEGNVADIASLTSQNLTVTGTLTADKIRANQIEGLDVVVNNLTAQKATIQNVEITPATASATLSMNSLDVLGMATVSADIRVKGNGLVEGILSVIDTVMTKNLIVSSVSDFFGNVIFHTDVNFQGRPTFNSDSGGFAVIKQGAQSVDVKFDKEYGTTPVVTANITLSTNNDATESAILATTYYAIVNRTTKGFTIKLNAPAIEDIPFSWSAVSIKDAKTSVGDTPVTPVPTFTPIPTPTLAPTLTPAFTPTPTPMLGP